MNPHPTYTPREASIAAAQQMLAMFSRRYTASADIITPPSEHELLAMLDSNPLLSVAGEGGNTLLHLAVKQGFIHLAAELIVRGADVNATNNAQQTPLHFAAYQCDFEIIKLLLLSGANANANAVALNQTPMHMMVTQRPEGIPKPVLDLFLNHYDFNPNQKDHWGHTALDYITRADSSPLAWQLAQAGFRLSESLCKDSDLGDRFYEAQSRWREFLETGAANLLCHKDLYLFANIGVLGDALAHPSWQSCPSHFNTLFRQLPLCFQREIIETQPSVLARLGGIPTPLIQYATAEPVIMQSRGRT